MRSSWLTVARTDLNSLSLMVIYSTSLLPSFREPWKKTLKYMYLLSHHTRPTSFSHWTGLCLDPSTMPTTAHVQSFSLRPSAPSLEDTPEPDVVEDETTASDADTVNLDEVLVAVPLPTEPSAAEPAVPYSESFHDVIMDPQAVLNLITNGDFIVHREVEVESNLLQPQTTIANWNQEVEAMFLPPDVNSAQKSRPVNLKKSRHHTQIADIC